MTRLVEHDATGPRKLTPEDVDPEKGDVAVCRCGLSAEYPFCDGTHRRTRDEAEETYVYVETDDGLERRRVERVVFADGAEKTPDPPDEPNG
ncbi:MAG: CDGSH iron-sulfur domain-containing protein [Halobacteriales archaeon]